MASKVGNFDLLTIANDSENESKEKVVDNDEESDDELGLVLPVSLSKQRLSVMPKSTKDTNEWAMKRFKMFLASRNIDIEFKTVSVEKLATLLQLFYSKVSMMILIIIWHI